MSVARAWRVASCDCRVDNGDVGESWVYMSRVSDEYGRFVEEMVFCASVFDGLMSTPRAAARERFRSRRPHSSSHDSGVTAGSLCGCWSCPFDATAFAALHRRS